MLRCCVAGIILAVAASNVRAQPSAPTGTPHVPVCADAALANYSRCALWLERSRVRRGQEGEVIATRSLLRPMPLTRILAGDSALAYARVYERNARKANVFGLIGLGLEVGAIVAFPYNRCDPGSFGSACPSRDFMTSAYLLVGSLASFMVSGHFSGRAGRAATRAVWWHNANFAR